MNLCPQASSHAFEGFFTYLRERGRRTPPRLILIMRPHARRLTDKIAPPLNVDGYYLVGVGKPRSDWSAGICTRRNEL